MFHLLSIQIQERAKLVSPAILTHATTLASSDEFPMIFVPKVTRIFVLETSLPRSRAARTARELVPIAGYYRPLVHAQERPGPRGAWGIGLVLCGLPRIVVTGRS
jgi:hypothetical protein